MSSAPLLLPDLDTVAVDVSVGWSTSAPPSASK